MAAPSQKVALPVATLELGGEIASLEGSCFSGYHEGIASRLVRWGWPRSVRAGDRAERRGIRST